MLYNHCGLSRAADDTIPGREIAGGAMAKKVPRKTPAKTGEKTSQARLELPSRDMERVRRAAKSIGLSLSAFIRQAVLEKAADVGRRMGP
jgi:hypothetical protein